MTSQAFLSSLANTCKCVVADAVSGISVCKSFEDASVIGFMQMHRLCGVRLLMLPMAAMMGVSCQAESVFDQYFSQLEDIKQGSRSLLEVDREHYKTVRRAAASAL